MAFGAVLAQNRLNVLAEAHALERTSHQHGCTGQQGSAQYQFIAHIAFSS
jgi:hypothetical protein